MRLGRLRRAESPWSERIDVFMFFASYWFSSTRDDIFYLAVVAVRPDSQLNLTGGVQAGYFKFCRLCALSTFYKALDSLLDRHFFEKLSWRTRKLIRNFPKVHRPQCSMPPGKLGGSEN